MKKITLATLERTYRNNGQHAEQVARFTLLDEIAKADNRPHAEATDVFDIQLKSARATVCKGTDLESYIYEDAATRFAYILADFSAMYVMSRSEWLEFCREFSTETRESTKNGSAPKLRLKHESKAMREWLERA